MSWKRMALVLILAGLSCAALGAQEPRRLADINVGAVDPLDDSLFPKASGFVAFGNRLIFAVQGTSVDDLALWSGDGTPGGTAPLPVSLCDSPCKSLAPMGVIQGGAILEAQANASGRFVTRIWRTDGTAAGTYPLTGPVGLVEERIVLDDPSRGLSVLYFSACNELDRCPLWRTDGSREGTRIVREFHAGNSNYGPHAFHVWNGRLVFIADDGDGAALWITDGTPEGTVRLVSVPDGERGAFFTQVLAATSSRLFFTSGYLSELWVTDGTPEGTRRLRAFQEALCPNHYYCEDPYTDALVPFGDEVYFTAAESDEKVEIWRSDGTEEGTVQVTHLPLPADGPRPYAWTLRRAGSRWFFVVGRGSGAAIWASEGDLAAAAPVTGCEGSCPGNIAFLGTLDAAGRQLFQASDSAHGTELWVTDGTGPGTRRLTDACPGPCSGFAGLLGSFPGGTYFLASLDPEAGPRDLWVTDGTPGGTHRVAEDVTGLAVFQGSTWFSAAGEDAFSVEIWRTDGTPSGTRQALDLRISAPGSSPMIFPRRGGGALMFAWDGTSRRLWRTDGTPRGTVRIGGLALDPELDSLDVDPLQIGPLQFFGITRQKGDPEDPDLFYEIWRTDGTTRGTFRLLNLNSDRFFWDLPAAWNGRFLFEVEEAGHCAFWVSDGTPDGTRELFPLRADSRCALAVRPLGPGFLFLARVPGRQGTELTPQLFYSDGTAAGTRQITRITGNRDGYGDFLQAVGGTILFWILDTKGEAELWRTDGTPAGTRRIGPLPPSSLFGNFYSFRGILYELVTATSQATSKLWRIPLDGAAPVLLHGEVSDFGGPESGSFSGLALAGDRALFAAWDEAHGAELWSTDGTPGGTRMLKDILPGSGESLPAELTAVGGRVFFNANDGAHGWELWESDGTPEGTRMVTDLRPGLFGSLPIHLTASGRNLYFSADDGIAGREPWVLSPQ